eukprot:219624-Chlamydomonas_euryale.AAC.2
MIRASEPIDLCRETCAARPVLGGLCRSTDRRPAGACFAPPQHRCVHPAAQLWSGGDAGTSWSSKPLSFGRLPMQNVTSAQWLPPRASGGEQLIVAGTDDGQLYVFKGLAAVKAIAAHRPGPKQIMSDGHPAHNGVRGLRAAKGGSVLLSGGADGTVLQWDTSDGSIQEARFAGRAVQLKSPFGPGDRNVPAVRALDYSTDLDRIVVGTSNCDVCE